jgi:predicted nucleic acid binding AN1-type Zn finger protein
MGLRETISGFIRRISRKEDYPLYHPCAICGERVYLPFRCEYCGRYYCDNHRMPFDHDCKNIGAWKNAGTGPGSRKK